MSPDPVAAEAPTDVALDARLLATVRCPRTRAALKRLPRCAYSATSAATVTVATLNCGGVPPPPGLDLRPWLAPRPMDGVGDGGEGTGPPPGDGDCPPLCHPLPALVAVCLQEVVPLSPANVLAGGVTGGADEWEAAVAAALEAAAADAAAAAGGGEGDADAGPAYARVPSGAVSMVGLHLALWVRSDAASDVSCVDAAVAAAGFGGVLGNKGLVALRLLLRDTSLVIIGAHLPSGDGPGDAGRRDACARDALSRGVFAAADPALPPAHPWRARPRLATAAADADVAFLVGDLNYRLIAPGRAVRRALAAGDAAKLPFLDELAGPAAAARGCPLAGWKEGALSFAPTYKLVPGARRYCGGGDDGSAARAPPTPGGDGVEGADASTDDPATARTPAWTDRVLWREKGPTPGDAPSADAPTPTSVRRAALLAYGSAPDVDVSDHRPVVATFDVAVRAVDPGALAAAAAAARRSLDAAESAAVPRCEVHPKSLSFGTLERGDAARAGLAITNVGATTAHWSFAPLDGRLFADGGPDNDPRPCPHWASLHPAAGALAPGESACVRVAARAGAGPRGAADAVAGADGALDAVLVVRVEGGNDEFVALDGAARPSCLGLAASRLAALARPLVPDDAWAREVVDEGRATDTAVTVRLPPLRTASGAVESGGKAALPAPTPPAPPSAVSVSSSADYYSPASSLASSLGGSSPFGGGSGGDGGGLGPSRLRAEGRPADGEGDGETRSRSGSEPPAAAGEGERDKEASPVPPPPPPPPPPLLHGLPPPATPSETLIPPEWRALLAFLAAPGSGATPALVAHAADRARGAAAAAHRPAAADGGWEDAGVDSLVRALDRGRPLPEGTHAADAAATQLTLLACLPTPLVPATVSAACDGGRAPKPAVLGDALRREAAAAEFASALAVGAALRAVAAAAPDPAAAVQTLAAATADFWLGPAPAASIGRVSAAGDGLARAPAAAVAGLQSAADAADAVDAARAALVAAVIEFGGLWGGG